MTNHDRKDERESAESVNADPVNAEDAESQEAQDLPVGGGVNWDVRGNDRNHVEDADGVDISEPGVFSSREAAEEARAVGEPHFVDEDDLEDEDDDEDELDDEDEDE